MTINAHPELPEFEYIRPGSLWDASRFLLEHVGEARPLLGGTDVFVRMRDGVWKERFLVDIKDLDRLKRVQFDEVSGLRIGAGVNMNAVIASQEVQTGYSLLAQACRAVASYQLRSRATIAGNICNASPAGDTIGACQVMDARLEIYNAGQNGSHSQRSEVSNDPSENGFREESLSGFFLGPGSTVLQTGDIVTAILFPVHRKDATGKYIKLGRNNWSDLSIVGVTVYAYQNSELMSGYRFRIALASVAPVPLLVSSVEEFLAEHPPGDTAFLQAAKLAQEECAPIDDVRGSARYRREMVFRLAYKGLQDVWSELQTRDA